jgi:hypothetical protein
MSAAPGTSLVDQRSSLSDPLYSLLEEGGVEVALALHVAGIRQAAGFAPVGFKRCAYLARLPSTYVALVLHLP